MRRKGTWPSGRSLFALSPQTTLAYAPRSMKSIAPPAALLAALLAAAAVLRPDPGRAQAVAPDSAAVPRSPLSFVHAVEIAYGFGGLRYEQSSPDSTGDFETGGRALSLRALLRLPLERTFLLAEYAGMSADSDIETVRHGGGTSQSELDPEITRMRLGVVHARAIGSRGSEVRGIAGWRWLRDDLVRSNFLLNGAPAAGAPDYTSENFRWGGFVLGLGATIALSRPPPGAFGWRVLAAVEFGPSLQGEAEDASGARFDLQGDYFEGLAGVEWGVDRHGIALLVSRDRASFEDSGLVVTPSGLRRMGPAEFRATVVQLNGRVRF